MATKKITGMNLKDSIIASTVSLFGAVGVVVFTL